MSGRADHFRRSGKRALPGELAAEVETFDCAGRWLTPGLIDCHTHLVWAATLFQMTVEECLTGVTRTAAQALGLGQQTGTLEPGKWADLAIWDIDDPAELVYRMGLNPLHRRVWRGQ